jgi:glycosyltransferase involved in cell wall biosynthesis
MKALFLTKYSIMGGSSKHMVYSYLEFYRESGIECVVSPLFDDRYFGFRDLQRPANVREIVSNAGYFSVRFMKRIWEMIFASEFDVIVLEKELIPYIPFGLERILRIVQPKIVTLYDDAVHVAYWNHPQRLVRTMCRNKIEKVIRSSYQVVVWNKNIGEFARRYNPNVSIVNTGIDLRRYRIKSSCNAYDGERVVIGWMGTPNSFPYIANLEGVFRKLSDRYNVELRIVSSKEYQTLNIPVVNRKWSIDTEVDDLCSFDIGIMPLVDDEWTRGKSSYKAVQYMGVGIPVVCSPVGVASEIVQDGVNGFLASTPEQWFDRLALLIERRDLRQLQGLEGRRMVEDTYSIQAVAPHLISILKALACK